MSKSRAGSPRGARRGLSNGDAVPTVSGSASRSISGSKTEDDAGLVIVLLRHAKAGQRSEWVGDDRLRPLSKNGRRQADAIVPRVVGELGGVTPEILTSPWVRCVQTVEPLGAAIDVDVQVESALGEGFGSKAVELAAGLRPGAFVLCSHGDVIGELLAWAEGRRGVDLGRHPQWPKGSAWILRWPPGAAKYLPAPD